MDKRIFIPLSGVILPFSYYSKKLDTKVLFSWKGRHTYSHFFGHISGPGSRHHGTFKLDLWPQCSFQTSLRWFKSVQPSPKNRCEFMKSRPKNHISCYISGTGSRCHDPFTLELWSYFSFQTSPSLSKSVQPSPRKRCEFDGSRPKNPISGYISGTGSHYHDPFTLDMWPHYSF